jgi:hypothetical protein
MESCAHKDLQKSRITLAVVDIIDVGLEEGDSIKAASEESCMNTVAGQSSACLHGAKNKSNESRSSQVVEGNECRHRGERADAEKGSQAEMFLSSS